MRSRRAKNPKNLEVEEIAHLKIHEETISYQDFGNGHGNIMTRITNPKGIIPNRNLNTSLKFRGRTPASHNSHYWGGGDTNWENSHCQNIVYRSERISKIFHRAKNTFYLNSFLNA